MSTYEWIALAVVFVWPLTGLVLGIVMARRGYNGFGWGIMGAFLGPVGVLLALVARLPAREDEVIDRGRAGIGTVDVLVGVDDSWECRLAAAAAASLLGTRTRRFMLATVVPFDTPPEDEYHAHHLLDEARGTLRLQGVLHGVEPGQVVLHGKPADALRHYAAEEGYDAIAVGCHGHGASKAVLGSTADALIRTAEVPLIVSDGRDARSEQPTRRRGGATVS